MPLILPVANGLSTDHPIDGLPFVDDSHIPVKDPRAIEKTGRHKGEGMWGREDRGRAGEGSWIAFTTDPIRHDLAWCVKYNPVYGRTVILVRDGDASGMHMQWWNTALLFRQGGYWWDGTTWYRPNQVWDDAKEEYDHRPVKSAITVTAADLLDDNTDPRGGRLLKVANFDLDAPAPDAWPDHLALWAERRQQAGAELPLDQCVVKLSAPELAGDQLIGLPELAELAGISASTLRAYIARGEGDVPLPQAVVSGRSAWAKPVAKDWIERRGRSYENVAAAVAGGNGLSVGTEDLMARFTKKFFGYLWERPNQRKRWALRHRNEQSVTEVAEDLSYQVVSDLDEIVPLQDLADTIRHAWLDELREGRDLDRDTSDLHIEGVTDAELDAANFYGINQSVARMLDWLIRHDPNRAQHVVNDIIGQAERTFEIPPHITVNSLRTALSLDGKLERGPRREFLDRVLPPGSKRDDWDD